MNSSADTLLKKDDSLLVVIDMQEKLVPVVADKEMIVENVIKLVRFCRIIDLPVMVTEQEKLGDTLPEIRAALVNTHPITKTAFSCFGSPAFREGIRQLRRNTLIIAGIEAHVCVAQTALQALPDYTVHVVSDAVSSRVADNRKVALQRMRQCGVTITSTEMVIFELLEKAGTPLFKEALPLVK
ncbi:MAG: hydrolase [Deltaproteobacteria bacterium]|nr:hydrolase [Deltaproteobacteria bacterium]